MGWCKESEQIFRWVSQKCRERGITDNRANSDWWGAVGFVFLSQAETIASIASQGGILKALQNDQQIIEDILPRLLTPEVQRALLVVHGLISQAIYEYREQGVKLIKDKRIKRASVLDEALLWTVEMLREARVRKIYVLAGGLLYAWGLLRPEDIGLRKGETFLDIIKDPNQTREYRLGQWLRQRAHRARKRIGSFEAVDPFSHELFEGGPVIEI